MRLGRAAGSQLWSVRIAMRTISFPERLRGALVWMLAAPVRVYRALVSPALGRRCKYEPTCSAYAIEALRTHGPLKGAALAAWRLLRCNPFSHGGYDPVEAQGLFGQ